MDDLVVEYVQSFAGRIVTNVIAFIVFYTAQLYRNVYFVEICLSHTIGSIDYGWGFLDPNALQTKLASLLHQHSILSVFAFLNFHFFLLQ